jgi:hypothetical protein
MGTPGLTDQETLERLAPAVGSSMPRERPRALLWTPLFRPTRLCVREQRSHQRSSWLAGRGRAEADPDQVQLAFREVANPSGPSSRRRRTKSARQSGAHGRIASLEPAYHRTMTSQWSAELPVVCVVKRRHGEVGGGHRRTGRRCKVCACARGKGRSDGDHARRAGHRVGHPERDEGCSAVVAAGRGRLSSEGAAVRGQAARWRGGAGHQGRRQYDRRWEPSLRRWAHPRAQPAVIEWLGGRPGSAVPWADMPISPESW